MATRGNGQGKGGAMYALDALTNPNGNDQGMPSALPIIIASCGNNFDMNNAGNNLGTDTDNASTYGTSLAALTNCLFSDSFED